MPITFQCDHCGKSLTARDESAGRLVNCSGCGRQLRVPTFIPASQPSPTGRLSSRDRAWVIIACSIGGVSLAVPCLIFLLALLGVRPADRAVERALVPPVAVSAPELVAGPPAKPTPALTFNPGTTVEITSILVAADRAIYDRIQRAGGSPAGINRRTERFSVRLSTKARVLEQDGGAVHLTITDGEYRGREGWVPAVGLRPIPTEAASAEDVRFGLPLLKRREIYAELGRESTLSYYEADRRVPKVEFPATAEDLVARDKRYEEVAKAFGDKAERKVEQRYGLDHKTLGLIMSEGALARWPEPRPSRNELPPIDQVEDPAVASPAPESRVIRLENDPAPKPKRPNSHDTAASNLLKTAKKAQTDGREERARALLGMVVKTYGETEAAGEARRLLKAMPAKP